MLGPIIPPTTILAEPTTRAATHATSVAPSTTAPASRGRRLVPESPLVASRSALLEDLANAGLTARDYNVICRAGRGESHGHAGLIEVYLDGARFSELGPKVIEIFDAAGFGKTTLLDPYTGYDMTYRKDENDVVYRLVRDQMGGAAGGAAVMR